MMIILISFINILKVEAWTENHCSVKRRGPSLPDAVSFSLCTSAFSHFCISLFFFSLSSPEFVPFFFCSLLFLWGAEANTTVFLYIKLLHFKHNTVVEWNLKFVGLSFFLNRSPVANKISCRLFCPLFCFYSASSFLPLRCSFIFWATPTLLTGMANIISCFFPVDWDATVTSHFANIFNPA